MSEYFRDLVRANQKQQAKERLETLLLRGLESPSTEWTKDDVNYVRNAVCERLAANKKTL
jgi:antitoxin ParD1/3/4